MKPALLVALAVVLVGAVTPRDRMIKRWRIPPTDATAVAADPTPTLLASYEWPYVGSHYPVCTDDSTCVGVCRIGARTGSTTAWECMSSDGGQLGTVTDPGTCPIIRTFSGGYAPVISGACAPSVTSQVLNDAIFQTHDAGWGQTNIWAGYGRLGAGSVSYWGAYNLGNGIFNISQASGNMTITTQGDSTNNSGTYTNSYFIQGSSYDDRANAFSGYIQSAGVNKVAATGYVTRTGSNWWFGTRNDKTLSLGGPLEFFSAYRTAKGDAGYSEVAAKWYGSWTTGNPNTLEVGNSQPIALDNTADSGNVDLMFGGSNVVQADGLHSYGGFTNVWAANALDLTGATDVGTPTINANVSSGPFAAYNNGAECDEMVTTNVLALDGKQSAASAGTAATWYHAGGFLKAGLTGVTRDKYTLAIVAGAGGTIEDGGTIHYCAGSGLTSTAQRVDCAALVSGTPASVKGQILVGNAIPDVGSIQVCQGQTTKSHAQTAPQPNNSVVSNIYHSTKAVSLFPANGLSGKVEYLFRPGHNPNVTWVDASSVFYGLDIVQATLTDHTLVFLYGYTVRGRMNAAIRGPSGEVGDIITDGVDLTPGQLYASAIQWVALGAGKCNAYVYHNTCGALAASACHATTLINSDTTGNLVCPATAAKMFFGQRFDNSFGNVTGTTVAVRFFGS